MKSIVVLTCIVFISHSSFSQKLSVGPAFGFHIRNNTGINEIADSLISIAQGSWAMHNVYSIFSEYQVNKMLNLKGSLNLTNQYSSYLIHNKWDTAYSFGPTQKGGAVAAINFNVVLTPELRIPIPAFINIYLIGGLRMNMNIPQDQVEVSFRDGTRHQGLAEAINNMDETIKPVYFNSVIGLKLEWRRIVIYGVLDKNLGRSFTNELTYYGQKYPFFNRTNTLTVTGGYKLFKFGKERKNRLP